MVERLIKEGKIQKNEVRNETDLQRKIDQKLRKAVCEIFRIPEKRAQDLMWEVS
jgi:hypothetical protein